MCCVVGFPYGADITGALALSLRHIQSVRTNTHKPTTRNRLLVNFGMLSLSLAPVYNHNLGTVQRIMNAAMPVGYSETLIKKIFDPPISKVFSRIGEGEADLFVCLSIFFN